MAKRDTYPQDRSLRARIDCLIESHSRMRTTLRSVRGIVADALPAGPLRDELDRQIAEAIDGAAVASEAISGMDA